MPADDDIRGAIESAEIIELRSRGGGGGSHINLDLARRELNDIGNAERFIARFGADCLNVRDIGWHVWDGRRWNGDGGPEQVRRWAHETAKSILEECQAVQRDAPEHWGTKADQAKRAELLFNWSKETGNRRRIEGMLTEAAVYRTFGLEDMDRDPNIINLQNGTLDLTGAIAQLRPHRREDRITKMMPVDFDPQAVCPTFDKFLARVQPDPAMRAFLQRWSGYSATGQTGEQCLVFHWGAGQNGKSTFVELVGDILGPYSATLRFASLAQQARQDGAQASPDMAKLIRARYVYVSEPERGQKVDEAKIKWITGQDTITARALYKADITFRPEFKITLLGNHKPDIRGQDDGIWRRMNLIPWQVSIPREERDNQLAAKLRAEASGVLNWILDGTRQWLERGLDPPAAVIEATATYRAEGDLLGRFINACVARMDGYKQTGKEMYDAFTAWCEANAERPWSGTGFGRALSEPGRGFEKDTRSGVVQYLNVQLVNVPERPRRGGRDDGDGPPPGHPASFNGGE